MLLSVHLDVSSARGHSTNDDAEPERRGINSIQLFRTAEAGWRIVAMIWDNEREGVEIPPDLIQSLVPSDAGRCRRGEFTP